MELELKLARVADEFSTDFHIAKDRAGPLFLSTETASKFILTGHLRGFQKRNIKIEINEDGSLITISGEKEVQETVMVGWRLHRKEKEMRVFKKAFKIPDGVILDKVKAKFDEESTLTISMPKKQKGIRGVSVEEVTTMVHELGKGGSSGGLQIDEDDHHDDGEEQQQQEEGVDGRQDVTQAEQRTEKGDLGEENKIKDEDDHHHDGEEQKQQEEGADGRQDVTQAEQITEKDDRGKGSEIKDDKEGGEEKDDHHEEAMEEKGNFKICAPIVAGSALFLSIVVFVIHFIRTKSQPGKRKD